MIPIIITFVLLFWLFKKIETIASENFSFVGISGKPKFTILFFLIAMTFQAQEKTVNYNVLRNGTIIGQMQFYQKTYNDDVFLKISSEVKTRLIFGIDIKTEKVRILKTGN